MRSRSRTWLAAAALLLPLLAPGGSSAQTVVGRVVEEGTLRPLRGVFLFLEDADGRRGGGVLTRPDGRFTLREVPGRYRLVAELIGYATTRSDWLELVPGETLERDLAIPVEAISLEGLQVEGQPRCQRRPAEGVATARVWDEARKALELARWSEEQDILRLRVVRYDRKLDARTLGVVEEQRFGSRGWFSRSPYQSLPAEDLARGGYVRVSDERHHDYFAPDAEALLSDSFLDGHCFRVVEGSADDPGLVGLEFEPVPDRELPDIRGVLWVDVATAELRRLDYRYVELPFRHGDWPQVGGRVEFDRLPTGMWIVRRWWIRMPVEMEERRPRRGRTELVLVSLAEQGAEVVSARTSTGELLVRSSTATLHGSVTVAPGGDPLSGAVVEVRGLDERAITGEDGSFRIPGLPDGTYTVTVGHTLLEMLGLGPQERIADLERGRTTALPVEVPLTPAAAAQLCDPSGASEGWVLLYGRVQDAAGPIPDAGIRLQVNGIEHDFAADSAGAYRACLARPRAVHIAARGAHEPRGGGSESLAPVRIPGPGFVRVDLQIVAPDAAAGDMGRVLGRLTGQVREEESDAPVEGAAISLRDTLGTIVRQALTGPDGRFAIVHPGDAREFTLTVDHIAYDRVAAELEFPPAQRLRLDVLVSTRPIEVAPIIVRERRQGLLAEMGFYDRRERSIGVAFDRADIERRAPSSVTDLIRGVAGWRVVPLDGSNLRWDVRAAATQRLNGRDCQPSIWIDGNRVRGAGEVRRDTMLGTQVLSQLTLSELIRPDEIEALELFRHASEVPVRFTGVDAACGVVLIWTRRSLGG